MPRNWRHRGVRRRSPRLPEDRAVPVACVQFVTTLGGQELAVMSRADYERLAAAAELDVVEGVVVAPAIAETLETS